MKYEWNVSMYSYSNSNKSITYFHWKIIFLAGIWTLDLPSSKPMHYQLSYPGLDFKKTLGSLQVVIISLLFFTKEKTSNFLVIWQKFFMLVLIRGASFLTTIYSLYFSHNYTYIVDSLGLVQLEDLVPVLWQ